MKKTPDAAPAATDTRSAAEKRRWPDSGNLIAISLLALLVAVVALTQGGSRIVETLSDHASISAQSGISLPTDWATGPASVVSGSFTNATATVSGVSIGARMLLAGGILTGALAAAIVASAMIYFFLRLRRGLPFMRSVITALWTAALTLMIGGVIGQGLTVWGTWLVILELNPDAGTQPFVPGGPIDPTAIGAGFILGVFVAVFRVGERLQRDTEGLV